MENLNIASVDLEIWQAACAAAAQLAGRNDGWAALARHALQRASWAHRDADFAEHCGRAIYYAGHAPGEPARGEG